ncbi:MAG: c-type cytochrome [Planctomycetia bacterium]|nr:c-type cytochrome [Planctomycetia bacterium]
MPQFSGRWYSTADCTSGGSRLGAVVSPAGCTGTTRCLCILMSRKVIMMIHSERPAPRQSRRIVFALLLLAMAWLLAAPSSPFGPSSAMAAEPQWIWAPGRTLDNKPAGSCYFRKRFSGDHVRGAKIEITCDENYILFVNGLKIGAGENWKSLDSYDIGPYLTPGENVVAIAAQKGQAGAAGIAARLTIERPDAPAEVLVTGPTWKTSLEKQAGWSHAAYDDSQWTAPKLLGTLGIAAPWRDQVQAAKVGGRSRFQVTREFRVEWVVPPATTGSLLTMTFNEFGHILASRENGPLLLMRDTDGDGVPETVSTYCDKVKNCQGILALNGDVYVTADGPDGAALYRLIDKDRDGKVDEIKPLIKFTGHMEEHGPHAVKLGPDGLIYVMLGNLTKLAQPPRADGPYSNYYEGDLVQPRYEDPKGFAMGVKAPGGSIVRTDIDGSFVEYFVGGLRNCYGMAFHPQGDLLTDDSDMESDEGFPWYRPTRVCHAAAGAEFGWRSGWAKWPDYYHDSLPAAVDTGPGSPTGMVVYDHVMFPTRYHRTMFVGDWSQGQILAVSLNPNGASYGGKSSVFIEGSPLNVTGLDVGPDGWLYFCTGGRGSEGGIYRVVWMGKVPPEVTSLGTGLTAALKQPQIDSAYCRQQIAAIKKQLGPAWDKELPLAASNRRLPIEQRTRALDLMQLFGPFPNSAALVELSRDREGPMRAKVAMLMGLHSDPQTGARLAEMLADPNPAVQRNVCEALIRSAAQPPVAKVLPVLASPDRFVAYAARKLLERMPRDTWQQQVLDATKPRIFLVGATAMMSTGADPATCRLVIDHCRKLTKGFLTDEDFIDLLRVCQLAIIKGEFKPADLDDLSRTVAAEYPSGDPKMNRELIRLLAYMESPYAAPRIVEQMTTNPDITERMQLAMHSSHFVSAWNTQQRMAVLEFFEQARLTTRGAAYGRYLDRVTREFVAQMTDDERKLILARGTKWTGAALGAVAKLPKDLDPATLKQLTTLDERLIKDKTEAGTRLRIGIAAILARSGKPEAMAYLREVFEKEPERRSVLAMGLAQQPDGENWPLLVRSLPVVQGSIATAVMQKLVDVDQKPDKPEAYRQLILLNLKATEDDGRAAAIALLSKWTEGTEGRPAEDKQASIKEWQQWFAKKYPGEPEATLPKTDASDKYTLEQLQKFLGESEGASGDRQRGAAVFAKARCASCHRFGGQGESLGPELTTVTRRFQQREILESILFPSQVISSQYATKIVTTTDGHTYTGIVGTDPDGDLVVLQISGDKVRVPKDQVQETTVSKVSTMPSGLLNTLSLAEIADLMAYLGAPPPENLTRRPQGEPTPRAQ